MPERTWSAAAAADLSAVIPDPTGIQPTRGPPASERGPSGSGPGGPAEIAVQLPGDHDRIGQDLNDVVVRRLFVAGLDLEAALGLLGGHRATPRVCHAADELDQAVRDIRNAIFEQPSGG